MVYSRARDLVELGYQHRLPELLRYLSYAVTLESRSEAFTSTYDMVRNLTASYDPYRYMKGELAGIGRMVAEVVEKYLSSANWDLRMALRVSAAANIIDTSVLGYSPGKGLTEAVWDEPALEEPAEVPEDRRVYLALDNAGEAEVDRLLAKALTMGGYDVTVLARGEPYEIDVTASDLGSNTGVPIVSTPGNKPPVVYVSDGFVIAKGLANAEAYVELGGTDSLHLFRVKCDVMSRLLGVPKNSPVVVSGRTLRKLRTHRVG